MPNAERPLDLEQQLKLYRSITRALTDLVDAREKWIAHVEQYGQCYCKNPFRAHIDRADEWSRAHLATCAGNKFWEDAAAERHGVEKEVKPYGQKRVGYGDDAKFGRAVAAKTEPIDDYDPCATCEGTGYRFVSNFDPDIRIRCIACNGCGERLRPTEAKP